MMFVPSFSRRRQRALSGHTFDLFKPRWIRHTFSGNRLEPEPRRVRPSGLRPRRRSHTSPASRAS